jgi:hypothetical protein
MACADIYNAATDTAIFQPRCQVAMWKAAQDIMGESPQTPDYARRVAWATNVLRDKAAITPKQLAMQVLRNPTIAANPGAAVDGDIQFQVNSIIGDLLNIG